MPESENFKIILNLSSKLFYLKSTVKAFVVPPKWQKNFIILREDYDKGYKIFIADENLFVCILIYFNKKTYIFSELLKNVRIIK